MLKVSAQRHQNFQCEGDFCNFQSGHSYTNFHNVIDSYCNVHNAFYSDYDIHNLIYSSYDIHNWPLHPSSQSIHAIREAFVFTISICLCVVCVFVYKIFTNPITHSVLMKYFHLSYPNFKEIKIPRKNPFKFLKTTFGTFRPKKPF